MLGAPSSLALDTSGIGIRSRDPPVRDGGGRHRGNLRGSGSPSPRCGRWHRVRGRPHDPGEPRYASWDMGRGRAGGFCARLEKQLLLLIHSLSASRYPFFKKPVRQLSVIMLSNLFKNKMGIYSNISAVGTAGAAESTGVVGKSCRKILR